MAPKAEYSSRIARRPRSSSSCYYENILVGQKNQATGRPFLELEGSSETGEQPPNFLVFLNQLHGNGNSTSNYNHRLSSEEKSSDRCVHFSSQPDEIHPVLSRHDMTAQEIQDTWYTEQYLRIMKDVSCMEEEEDS
mmetsp:Transcript_8931/g.15647  ORF Transcript_8931/g.15647 Transcript_8931/m.15647 type:complete len:136 (-) Transcript_8931:202-609(-)